MWKDLSTLYTCMSMKEVSYSTVVLNVEIMKVRDFSCPKKSSKNQLKLYFVTSSIG